MKSLMDLALCVLADASTWCDACTTRDANYIARRVEHEGLEFLTITLPTFAKGFERSLELGRVDTPSFSSFRRMKKGPLPTFLSGLSCLVFDVKSGVILDEPNIDAIFFLRQFTMLFKKILLPCSLERERSAYASFIECENEIGALNNNFPDHLLDGFGHVADLVWGNTLGSLNEAVVGRTLVPRHGPGATADRITGNRKFEFKQWYTRLEEYFPADSFLIPNWDFLDRLEEVDFIEPGKETPVRVISVPKTLKAPRIIGIEPTANQYCQQAILEPLVQILESCSLLRGAIGITDQVPNREFARISSQTRSHSTLDLSEASDRVSSVVVRRMLDSLPHLRDAIFACRSEVATVPGFGDIRLAKFASMGSALCFPIEAMVFLTIIIYGILESQSQPVTLRNIRMILRKGVRVYGDDIIVPVEYASIVTSSLSLFGLKVNVSKSFTEGNFRESCGLDAFGGQVITPVYVRRTPPKSLLDAREIVSWTDLRNQFYHSGMWASARYVQTLLERIAPFPAVSKNSPVLGFTKYDNSYQYSRKSQHLHSPVVKGCVMKASIPKSELSDYGALMKYFLKRGELPSARDHLERLGRPVSVALRRGWYSPY
jgi:hypothetical protein